MSGSHGQTENTIHFGQCLDGRVAVHARAVIEATPPEAELVLDFTRVRDVEYIALATIIVALARRRGRRVSLHGLSQQHYRLLRYLGTDIEQLGRVGTAPVPTPDFAAELRGAASPGVGPSATA